MSRSRADRSGQRRDKPEVRLLQLRVNIWRGAEYADVEVFVGPYGDVGKAGRHLRGLRIDLPAPGLHGLSTLDVLTTLAASAVTTVTPPEPPQQDPRQGTLW